VRALAVKLLTCFVTTKAVRNATYRPYDARLDVRICNYFINITIGLIF